MNKVPVGIRKRILLSFMLLALTGVASSLWNAALLLEHEARLERLHEENLPALIAAFEISRQGESIAKAASSLIRTPDKWTRDAFINRITDQFNWLDRQLGILSSLGYGADSLSQIKQNKEALRTSFDDLTRTLETAEAARQSPAGESALSVTAMNDKIDRQLSQHKYHADLMVFSVADLANNVSAEIEGLISEAQSDIQNEVWQLTLYSIVATLFAVLVVLYLDTNVGRRVVAIQRAMRGVANGDKSEEIPYGGNDEISDMGGALRTFVERLGEREERLRELVENAEKANRDKSVFLAAASHDMRQPLQAMNLFFYALKNNETSPANREIMGFLEQSAASLGHILDRLLDLSRLEAGVIKIEKQSFPIGAMFNQLIDEFSPSAADKGLRLGFVPCSLSINTDPVLLKNILRNLIANAIKNTDDGRVLIGCRRRDGDALQIQVWDTGKGIAQDQHEKIFSEFYQLGDNPENAQKGLGLGLSIVQKVAALLNHELVVSSEPGHGAMFSITVPLERNSTVRGNAQANAGKLEMPENLSIIVIDDEEVVRKSLSIMLATSNNHVVAAPCVDCLDDVAMLHFPREMPNIIIADYRLANGKTGVEAISSLCEFYEKDIPAILLTGDTAPERLQEITQSGYSLLHKPVNAEELLMQIQGVLSQKPATEG